MLLLAIDTCGQTGSAALGRLTQGGAESAARSALEVLGEIELEGRSYSSTLISAVGDLLKAAGIGIKDLGAIVAVHGPGSFTGVRIGLSAVKGLSEPLQIPVVVVSRLEVLAAKSGLEVAAIDAHRGEVFLRMGGRAVRTNGAGFTEMLAGAAELKAIEPAPAQVAVCDDAAAALLASAWPATRIMQVAAPTASDALRLGAARVGAGAFVDLALLDGNYLRRSDAEIFGEATEAKHA